LQRQASHSKSTGQGTGEEGKEKKLLQQSTGKDEA